MINRRFCAPALLLLLIVLALVSGAATQFCGDGSVDVGAGEECDLGMRMVVRTNTLTRVAGLGPSTLAINATFHYDITGGANMMMYGLQLNGQYVYQYHYTLACGELATGGNGTAIQLSVAPQNVDLELATNAMMIQWTYWAADASMTCANFANASAQWSGDAAGKILSAFSFRWTADAPSTVYLYWTSSPSANFLAPNTVCNNECCGANCRFAADSVNLLNCPSGAVTGLGLGPTNFTCRPGGLCAYALTYAAAEPICPYDNECGLANSTYFGCNSGPGEMCSMRTTNDCVCGSVGFCEPASTLYPTAPCVSALDCPEYQGLPAYCNQNCCEYYATPITPSPTSLPTSSSSRSPTASPSPSASSSPTDVPAVPESDGSSSSSSSSSSGYVMDDDDVTNTPTKSVSLSRTPTGSNKATRSQTRSVTPSPSVKPTPHKNMAPVVGGVIGGVFGACLLVGVCFVGAVYAWNHYVTPAALASAQVEDPAAFGAASQSGNEKAANALIRWRIYQAQQQMQMEEDYSNF